MSTPIEPKETNRIAHSLEPLVSESPYNTLLRDWKQRNRMLGRDVASHPKTLRRVMSNLDTLGQSEAGDCIQSLVFELQIARNRAQRFAEELTRINSHD